MDPALIFPETLQSASINPDPSPSHDINPPTSASRPTPVVEQTPSEPDSIPSDVVDPHRSLQPVPRRHNLPPLPDLRFEQSYLASIRDAESWGRVAWITVRDQVSISSTVLSCIMAGKLYVIKSNITRSVLGHAAPDPRYALDARSFRLAVLEPQCLPQRTDLGQPDPTVVV